eukprot:Blabericola_migrator_1__5300@NODE_271_length_10510_cov_106_175333_g226_i0_p2_GENE_NODE_271_length_10510_cov_106_175333_g226_i0NODE_271_length_10510_cov_106_175333_g226_i0_p2_ORF_typecomplete_len526_score35_52_NODE_271_length_10510_cov_106_175333_g226_i033114888
MLLQRLFWSLMSRLEGLLLREILFRAVSPPSIAFVSADLDSYNIELGETTVNQRPNQRETLETERSFHSTAPAPRFANSVFNPLSYGAQIDSYNSLINDEDEEARRVVHKMALARPLLTPTLTSLLYDDDTYPDLPCLSKPMPTIESHPHLTEELLGIAAKGNAQVRQRIADAAARYRLRWESATHKAEASGATQILVSGWPWTTDVVQATHRCNSSRAECPTHTSLRQLFMDLGLINHTDNPRAPLNEDPPRSADARSALFKARAVVFQHTFLDVVEQVCVSSNVTIQVLGHVDHPNLFLKTSTLPRLKTLRAPRRFALRADRPPLRIILCIGSPMCQGFSITCCVPKWHGRLITSGNTNETRAPQPLACAHCSPELHVEPDESTASHRTVDLCAQVGAHYQKALKRNTSTALFSSARDPFISLLLTCKLPFNKLESVQVAPEGDVVLLRNHRIFYYNPAKMIPIDVVLYGSLRSRTWSWQREIPGRKWQGLLLGSPMPFVDPRWWLCASCIICCLHSWRGARH